jgi:hypothetical protein
VLQAVPDPIVVAGSDGHIIFANGLAERLFGYEPGELTGQPLELLLPERHPGTHVRDYEAYFAVPTERSHGERSDFVGRRKDGSEITVDIERSPCQTPDGPVAIASIRDLTEQRAAAAALSEAQTLTHQLIEQSLIGISITQDERLVFVSPTLLEISGYTRDELLAMPSAVDLVPEEDRQKVREAIKVRLESGAQVRYTTRMRHKEGHLIHLEVHGGLVQYRGRPAVIAAALNITERVRLEQQMLQVQKIELVGRLAGGVAHDFNNVLTVVKGHSEALGRKLGADGAHHRHVAAIQGAADRAGALTKQLLSLGRRQLVEPQIIDLNTVVSTLHRLLPSLLGEEVETIISLAPDLSPIHADPRQLEQVLLNLVMNARDAMPDGGALRIHTAMVLVDETFAARQQRLRPGSYVTLTVSDDGTGMDEVTRDKIFEPFFTTKAVGRGVGLGLSTVHDIIVQAGGVIQVETEPARGSTFSVYFTPVDGEPSTATDDVSTIAITRGTETLLVVDDEAQVREVMRQTLAELGYTVLTAATGQEALQTLEAHGRQLDLLVTDVVMPRMSGDTLAREIWRVAPRARVLFMSGYADEVLGRHGALDSGVALLRKPFSTVDLVLKIRDVLGDS